MISVRLGNPTDAGTKPWGALVLPVVSTPQVTSVSPPPECADEVFAFLADDERAGEAGRVSSFSRPLHDPSKILLVGAGSGDSKGWRKAGGALARAARDAEVTVLGLPREAVVTFAEGLWLGEYTFRLGEPRAIDEIRLERVMVLAGEPSDLNELEAGLDATRVITRQVNFARDLTNMPSLTKTPAWFVDQVLSQGVPDIGATVREPERLIEEGFGGIMAVGGGSAHGPRLLELTWSPPGATKHVVLVGKGITYDTGGIDIKPLEHMQLMRKDMGGAATVVGATLAAAQLGIQVKVTALAPLAENMLSGSAWRPGDVVRHYGGLTSEVHSTDAEGRVVLADAMAYAVAELAPDVILDFATLTGAARIALGKTTAAIFTDNELLAKSMEQAAALAGENVWRMPLADDYLKETIAEIADLNNAAGNPGAITAALYLREFAGTLRDRWLHVDMSAPSWSAENDGELRKGATGWGVRTIVNWLSEGVQALG
ncbi:MAG TPA: leucyl aminopeptidase family protein [Candidatus Limnocylindrales bacterium]|nr:leucyl aminopeptidase family protein [Candidatus Limnocylindrales bacterium]